MTDEEIAKNLAEHHAALDAAKSRVTPEGELAFLREFDGVCAMIPGAEEMRAHNQSWIAALEEHLGTPEARERIDAAYRHATERLSPALQDVRREARERLAEIARDVAQDEANDKSPPKT